MWLDFPHTFQETTAATTTTPVLGDSVKWVRFSFVFQSL